MAYAHDLGSCFWGFDPLRGHQHQERNADMLFVDVWEEFYADYDAAYDSFLWEFKKYPSSVSATWPILNPNTVKKVWSDYAKMRFVNNSKAVEKIALQSVRIIAYLQASTEISGHTPLDARRYIKDCYSEEFTDDEWDGFVDFVVDDEEGECRLSDYGLPKLIGLIGELKAANTYEEVLVIVDRMLNVAHQRNDLSKIFIRGGVKSLDDIKYNRVGQSNYIVKYCIIT